MSSVCYFQVFVEYVTKNPACDPNQPIKSELFAAKLNEFIINLPIFGNSV